MDRHVKKLYRFYYVSEPRHCAVRLINFDDRSSHMALVGHLMCSCIVMKLSAFTVNTDSGNYSIHMLKKFKTSQLV